MEFEKVLTFFKYTFKSTGTDIFSKQRNIPITFCLFSVIIIWTINGFLDGLKNIHDTELGGLSVSIIFLTYGLLTLVKFATVNLMKERYLYIVNWMKNLYRTNKRLDITLLSKDIMRKCLRRSQFMQR